jgi:hypothetical protein
MLFSSLKLVLEERLELSRELPHWDLNPARMPIPPLQQNGAASRARTYTGVAHWDLNPARLPIPP